ncbi:unnamed protein product [Clonostachys byssicola]|uniref:Uncharacterized protein n=1 Tax=Clonostachys byssicola TaxID=160290 RepID=A0A9N9UAQ0_9HYPO|nr:unnamed protein product [Clonostachys byssicola]
MSLESLPPELQSKIYSYMVTSFGPSSIHALLRISKQLHAVALPLSVQIFRNTAPLKIGKGPCSVARNAQFLRYILVSRPELANKVDTVILGGFAARSSESNPHASSPEELETYEQLIIDSLGPTLSKVDVERRDKWIFHLKRGYSDAQISLILLACPNIKRLYFEDFQEPSNEEVFEKPPSFMFLLEMAQILSASGGSESKALPLGNVKHVHVQSQYGNTCGWEQAIRLLALPKLQTYESLNATYQGKVPGDSFVMAQLPKSSVRSVAFHQSHAPASEVKFVLDACDNLTSFEYISAMWMPIDGSLPRDIMRAVLPHAETLTRLYLDFQDDCEREDWRENPHGLYLGRELAQMTALRYLNIGMQALIGMFDPIAIKRQDLPLQIEGAPRIVECLPEKLQELRIRECGKAIVGQAAELLDTIEKGQRFQNLQCIVLMFKHENIEIEDIQQGFPELTIESTRYSLAVSFQNRKMRWLDSGRGKTFEGIRAIPSLCSRIFADDLRRDWIDFRGLSAVHTSVYGRSDSTCFHAHRVDPGLRIQRLLLQKPPHEFGLDD